MQMPFLVSELRRGSQGQEKVLVWIPGSLEKVVSIQEKGIWSQDIKSGGWASLLRTSSTSATQLGAVLATVCALDAKRVCTRTLAECASRVSLLETLRVRGGSLEQRLALSAQEG